VTPDEEETGKKRKVSFSSAGAITESDCHHTIAGPCQEGKGHHFPHVCA
jgi:hypothetical protein